jgi:hypothetical protein
MQAIILAAALLAGGCDCNEAPEGFDAERAAAQIAPQLQTGSLIFSQGDCLAIKAYAGGPYTHVAAVVMRDGVPVVYDSMNGVGVRKLPLKEYLATQAPDEVEVFQPRTPFSAVQAAQFESSLESRMGTPYAVWHHVTGERARYGVHCSEYVTDALIATDMLRAERPSKVSPTSLARGITQDGLYSSSGAIALAELVPVEDVRDGEGEGDNWCEQMWLDTKVCCSRYCDQLSAWFLCR